MKKMIAALLPLALLVSLTGCGANSAGTATPAGSSGNETAGNAAAPVPAGLYMLKYLGDEEGQYVAASNEYTDYFNRPVTLLEMLYQDNTTLWCEIGEDGTGTYHGGTNGSLSLDFNTGEEGMLRYGGEGQSKDELVPFRYDVQTGEFWFEEEPGFWDVMLPCSQERLDLVFAGKGGTVPVKEAEIGDLVSMGEYLQTLDAEETEPLSWRVIDKDGDKVLLLCDKLIDSFSYNYNPEHAVLTDVTWENCSVREFLNLPEGFLSIFTEEEIARMLTTHLENKAANEELMAQWGQLEDEGSKTYSDLSVQDRPDDPDTDDKIFLLSYQEVLKYFGEPTEDPVDEDYPFSVLKTNKEWLAYVTDAVTSGYYFADTGCGAWMTRTLCNSHSEEDMVVYISGSGNVFDYYTYVPLFIRPAVWVSQAD